MSKTHTQGLCPVCAERLPRATKQVGGLVVPEGATEAPYNGPGEVLRRGPMRRATIAGRPEIVQDLSVWFGDFKTTFGPFCSSTCAGRFGLAAWEQGVRLAQPVSNLPKPVKAGQKLIEGLTQIAEAVKGPETNSRRPKRQLLAAPNKEEGKTIKRPDIPAYTRAGIPKSVWDTMSVQQRGVIYWRLRMAEKGKGQGKPLNGSDFLNPGD